MLKRNRGYILLGVSGLATFAVSIWVIWLAADYSYREIYESAGRDEATQNYQPARDGTRPPQAPKGQPANQAYQPNCEQPQTYNNADLCAQWSAVRAVAETNRLTRIALRLAYIGFWVALLGGLIGIIGTVFLVRSFREASRANAIARESMEGQLRPWVNFKIATHGDIGIVDGNLEVCVDVTFRNQGTSPAIDLTYMGTMILGPLVDPHFRSLIEHFRTNDHDWADKNLFHSEQWERSVVAVHSGELDPIIEITFVVIARYRTPFSSTYRFTARAFDVGPTQFNALGEIVPEGHRLIEVTKVAARKRTPVKLVEKQHFSGYAT